MRNMIYFHISKNSTNINALVFRFSKRIRDTSKLPREAPVTMRDVGDEEILFTMFNLIRSKNGIFQSFFVEMAC